MITKQDIQNLAELARLEVRDAEVEELQKDISNILNYVGQLSATGDSSTALQGERGWLAEESPVAPRVLRNVMRDDTPREKNDPFFDKEEALRQAFPVREGNYNVVRKIISKDE